MEWVIGLVAFGVGVLVGRWMRPGVVQVAEPPKPVAAPSADALAVILHNIETYDGTACGQRDVPKEWMM